MWFTNTILIFHMWIFDIIPANYLKLSEPFSTYLTQGLGTTDLVHPLQNHTTRKICICQYVMAMYPPTLSPHGITSVVNKYCKFHSIINCKMKTDIWLWGKKNALQWLPALQVPPWACAVALSPSCSAQQSQSLSLTEISKSMVSRLSFNSFLKAHKFSFN